MGALSIPLPFPLTPPATEALALWHRLNYCRQLGVTRVMVKGDALNKNSLGVHGWDFSEIGGVVDAVRITMR